MFLAAGAIPIVDDAIDSKDPKSSDFGKELNLVESQRVLSKFTNEIIAAFTVGRERVFELQTAITNAVPAVAALGGEIKDVSKIIADVALESRRNVVASTEEITKLFAASEIIGVTAQKLSKDFLDVGMGIESIPAALEDSIEYVQSIGGNAKSVMTDVSANMEKMNRFQFEDGVRGLTRMAAQASMLRFSMSETFSLADRVLDPKGAIDTAAAFQRLGVAVGSLGNPLQLMNQAINDPSGLQDSLVEVSKQFTYFDDQTKTFKINPQGVLTLRELEKQTQVSAAEMTKMGLAAADLDRRLATISPSIDIKEEDKEYFANIAKMDKDGKYTVEIKNEQGKSEFKNLADITQNEFNKLIDEQRSRPRTLEDIARAQLRADEISANNLTAIATQIVGGTLTAPSVMDLNENIRSIMKAATDSLRESPLVKTEDVRKKIDGLMGTIGTSIEDITDRMDGASLTDPEGVLKGIFNKLELGDLGIKLQADVLSTFGTLKTDILDAIEKDKTNSRLERIARQTTDPVVSGGISVGGMGGGTSSRENPLFSQATQPRTTNVTVGGTADINVKFQGLPESLNSQELLQTRQMLAGIFPQIFVNSVKTIINDQPKDVPYRTAV